MEDTQSDEAALNNNYDTGCPLKARLEYNLSFI